MENSINIKHKYIIFGKMCYFLIKIFWFKKHFASDGLDNCRGREMFLLRHFYFFKSSNNLFFIQKCIF